MYLEMTMLRRLAVWLGLLLAATLGLLAAMDVDWPALLVVAAFGAANIATAGWAYGRVSRALRLMTGAAEQFALGNLGHRVFAGGSGEIGKLAQAFNSTGAALAGQFSQLEADRQQLRAILSGMVEGVIALDAEQRVLFANDRAAQLLELRPSTTAGRLLWEAVRQRSLHDLVQRAMSGSDPCQEVISCTGATPRHLLVYAARLSDSAAQGAVLVLHDISDLRRLEQVRREFVANVSHELKTPLAVIRACADTLLDGAIDDKEHRRGFLEQITEQAERLHSLVIDMLTLNRIEAGTEHFEYRALPLQPLIKASMERQRARADSKHQSLELIAPEDNGKLIQAWADEGALEQVMDNLIDNAVKYTPANGMIRVRYRCEGDMVVIDVEDTGIGISDRDLPRVFERFYRVDKARSRELGGTGLGLAIVKHLTQAMQGSVGVTSRYGQGSKFSVRLPRASENP
jgi:two-component system phosphate regulon sensor histidine kinase PhoR